jgi:cellulose synthase/poly-beta-1,6-N-acetylglucosamine synthase-like glycosyltransferase
MRIGAAEAVVTVVIPCLDEEVAIGGLVEALKAQGVNEAIVVDGGSHDRTVERAKAAGAEVVVETRRGYGRACATVWPRHAPTLRSSPSWTATARTIPHSSPP